MRHLYLFTRFNANISENNRRFITMDLAESTKGKTDLRKDGIDSSGAAQRTFSRDTKAESKNAVEHKKRRQ